MTSNCFPRLACLSLAAAACCADVNAEVRLPAVLSDGLVVARDKPVPMWGWARPGETIRISADWIKQHEPFYATTTTAGADGRWQVDLPSPAEHQALAGPYSITVQGENSVRIENVLVGELWLCSGQSNMEWPLSQTDGAEADVAAANHPAIRLFTVKNAYSLHQQGDVEGSWVECSPQTVASFRAVGYHFAREMQAALNMPIGLISADWGGTRIEAWMSEHSLRSLGRHAEEFSLYEQLRDPMRREHAMAHQRDGWWNALDAMKDGPGSDWLKPGFDDGAWPTASLPSSFSGGLASFDGVVYHRFEFQVSRQRITDGGTIELGPIDDRDDVWVNGVHVGSTREDGLWSRPRAYDVPPEAFRPGRNVVAVRVLDTAGPGGIFGKPEQMQITLHQDGKPVTKSLAGTWRQRSGAQASQLPPMSQPMSINQNSPSVLFNAMIAPLRGLRPSGVLWYQGESNVGDPEGYREMFPAMIGNWRSEFHSDSMPFHFVQIAPFSYRRGGERVAELREAQAAALSLPHTGMVVTMDIGDASDIHPRNKREVGRRLALLALAKVHGRTIECSGPTMSECQILGGVQLSFTNAQGLKCADDTPDQFLIAGADRVFYPAHARVTSRHILLSSPSVDGPVAVRYAWGAAASSDIVNGAGLPAPPFRTDNWESETVHYEDGGRTTHLSQEPGFAPLFNGRDLEGWVNVNGAPSTWPVERGMIRCSGIPTGVLRTAKMYENFILELEWRHLRAGGNAGVFVWSDAMTRPGVPFTRSVEVQVMDGSEGPGHTSDGDIFAIHGATMTPENPRPNSDRAFPTEKRMNPSPQWNHYRITCVDGSIDLAVNGKVVTRGRDISPRVGHICLESEGSPIDFRNIIIKELPPSTTRPLPEQVARTDEGSINLYNGVNFDGWKFEPIHEGHWKARDWVIDYDGKGADLWTSKSYRDFELTLDWRWPGEAREIDRPAFGSDGAELKDSQDKVILKKVMDAGDSGVYLRGSSKAQVNLWCWPAGSGELWGYRTDAAMPAEVRAAATPKVNADNPPGQWNRMVIIMKGDRVWVRVNDKLVIENAHMPGVPAEGPIALQMHNELVQFANIAIRELK